MALPNFIDVVTLTVGKQVQSSYRGGSTPLFGDHDLKYVDIDAAAPDAGDAVIGQAQIGVQRQTKNEWVADRYMGMNASIIVSGDDTVFAFNAAATGETQINPEVQGQEVNVPQPPQFSSSIFWV